MSLPWMEINHANALLLHYIMLLHLFSNIIPNNFPKSIQQHAKTSRLSPKNKPTTSFTQQFLTSPRNQKDLQLSLKSGPPPVPIIHHHPSSSIFQGFFHEIHPRGIPHHLHHLPSPVASTRPSPRRAPGSRCSWRRCRCGAGPATGGRGLGSMDPTDVDGLISWKIP